MRLHGFVLLLRLILPFLFANPVDPFLPYHFPLQLYVIEKKGFAQVEPFFSLSTCCVRFAMYVYTVSSSNRSKKALRDQKLYLLLNHCSGLI